MKIPFQPINREHYFLKEKIITALKSQLLKSKFINDKYLSVFEQKFAKFLNIKYVIGVGNGFDALRICLLTLGIKKDDEVLVPTNSFIASALSVSSIGAIPVFLDINKNYGIDLDDLRKKISNKTKAIIIVHLHGIPDQIEDLIKICRKEKIKIIEDCAQAHGSMYKGKKVGTFGEMGAFSFYPTKNLGALGDGGCISTDSKKLMLIAKSISNYGLVNDNYKYLGVNSRLDEIQAHFLLVKLNYLEKWNSKRIKYAKKYLKGLSGIDKLILPNIDFSIKYCTWHHFPIRCDSKVRNKLIKFLQKDGIETAIHYKKPIHKCEIYLNQKIILKTSEKINKEIISLPINEFHNEKEIDYVIESIKRFFR